MNKLRFAIRTLLKAPSVTLIAIASLALGIGSNVAIFSLFNEILIRPLPVVEPNQLVNLGAPGPKPGSQSCNNAGACDYVFSFPMFRDLERERTVFTGIAAHRIFSANLSYEGQTINGEGMLVSGGYFPVLGLTPALGRLLGPGDDRAVGQSPVVVLGHAYWRSRFAESSAVLNQTLIVNGQAMTIVGVAPRDFDGTTLGSKPQVFVPITMRGLMQPVFSGGFENRRSYWAYLFARLKPGTSMELARAAINVPYRAIISDVEAPLQSGMSDQTMQRFKTKELTLEAGARGQSEWRQEARAPLLLLTGVTAFVLLIACANVANLLLVRAAGRSGEMAVRLSLGASRRQLMTQLLAESCLLAALGGVAGLFVARWTLDLIVSLLPLEAVNTIRFEIDGVALSFAAVLTLGAGILFGLFPALQSTRPNVLSTLKGQAGQPAGARAASRFRAVLATAQIAISMTLLISAGLFTKSLFNISRVDLGLNADNLVIFGISPELSGYKPDRSRALFERLEVELAALPGVSSVTAAVVPLLSGNNWGSGVSVQGFQAGPDTDTSSRFNEVGPGYLKTLGIPLMSGREFTRSDALGTSKVAIVNEQFAQKFNLGREAVGKRMRMGGGRELDIEIVGLAQDAKYSQVKDAVPPLVIIPYRQDERLGYITYYVRTALDEQQLLSAIPPLVRRLDANLPVEDLRTMANQIRENTAADRVIGVLTASFAVLATILAAVGLYGVLAYTVAQRTKEIGLRMALGAAPGSVRRMVLRQVGTMTLIGGGIGLGGAIGLGRVAQSMLFELEGHDPVVIAASIVALAGVALGAGFVPARRAAQVDPMRALRYE